MGDRKILPLVLALIVVPIALSIAGGNLKTVILAILIFWICLGIFFYPNIDHYFKARKKRNRD